MSALAAEGLALAARAQAQAARRSLPVYNRPALTAWHAALADRENAPAKIVWLGDSITEGAQASAYGKRWVDRALAGLRTAFPTPGTPNAGTGGGFNHLPAISGGGVNMTQGQPWTALVGSWTPSNPGSFGLGERCVILPAVDTGMSFAVTCSSFQVHWVRGSGLGTMTIAVDGTPLASFSTAGALGEQVWSSGPLPPGARTVTVTRTAGGSVYLAGLTLFHGDETKGIQGHEAARWGWTSGQLATVQPYVWNALGGVAPQLVTLAIGTNDYQAQVPIATFIANLRLIVTKVRAYAGHTSIALVTYSRRGDAAVPQPIDWPAYVDAAFHVADTETGRAGGSGVAVIDLSQRLPDAVTAGTADPLGVFDGDRVHYSTKGHALIGELVAAALAV